MNLFLLKLRLEFKVSTVGLLLLAVLSGPLARAQYDSPGSDAIVDDTEYHADSAAQEKADKAIDAVADEAIRAKRGEDRRRMKRLGLEAEKPKLSPKKTGKKSKVKSKKQKSAKK